MAKRISSLSVVLGGSVAPFTNAFAGAGKTLDGFKSKVASVGSSVLAFTGIGAGIAAAFGAIKGAASGITLASQLEQTQVAFTTMLQSGDAAKAMMQQLSSFAAATPFEFPEIASAAKSLLAFGVSAQDVQPDLQKIGDIASGVGAPLGDIAEMFGKAKVQGTLYAEDINQLVGRGIPVIQQFAKQLGVSEGEVKKMASDGKISFGMLDKAFTDLTASGGQFSGMMEAQSHTLGGLWSTFTDNVGMATAGVVTKIVDAFHLKDALSGLSDFVGTAGAWFNAAIDAWTPLFVTFGLNVWNAITSSFSAIYSFLMPIVTSIGDFIARNWQASLTSVTGYLVSLWSIVSVVFDAALTIVTSVGEGIVAGWNWAMETLGVTTADTGSTVGNIFQGIADVGRWFEGVLTVAFTSLAYVIGNWRDVVGLAISAVELGVVQAGAEIVYQFGTVVPAIVMWAASNWKDILTDMGTLAMTVFANVGTNLTNFMSAVSSLLTGGGFSFEWTGLTTGFESSLKTMPQIAARQIGPIEQGLQDQFDAMQQTVGAGLDKALAGNKSTTKNITDGITGAVKNGLDNLPKVTLPAPTIPSLAPIVPKVDTTPADAAMDKTKDKAKETHDAIANIGVGSAEQLKRIATAALPTMPDSVPPVASAATTAAPIARAAVDAVREKPQRDATVQAKAIDGPALMTLLTAMRQLLLDKGLLTVEEVG